jgi:membrane protein required for colicin V production
VSWVDWLIVVGCLGSAGFGVWRGFAQEALSVISWLAAIWLAWRFSWVIEPLLGDWAVAPELKVWAARALIFLLILITGGVITWFVRELLKHSGLNGTDRVLGSIFGLMRGVIIVGLAAIILEFTGLDGDPWWQEARLSSFSEQVAGGIRYYAELGSRYF